MAKLKTITAPTAEDVKKVEGLSFKLGAVLTVLVSRLKDAHFPNNSVEYVAENALFTGIKTIDNSKGYSIEMQDLKGFKAELVNDPSLAANPEKMVKLMQKYRIGATIQS